MSNLRSMVVTGKAGPYIGCQIVNPQEIYRNSWEIRISAVAYECLKTVGSIVQLSTNFNDCQVIKNRSDLITEHIPTCILNVWGEKNRASLKHLNVDSSPWLPIQTGKSNLHIHFYDLSKDRCLDDNSIHVQVHVLLRRVA